MPLVIVTRDPKIVTDKMVREIGPHIQELVAMVLTVSDNEAARLNKNDVEVWFRDIGPFDIGVPKFSIKVFANEYAGRRKNLQERTAMIRSGLENIFTIFDFVTDSILTDCSIWVLLAPAGFERL